MVFLQPQQVGTALDMDSVGSSVERQGETTHRTAVTITDVRSFKLQSIFHLIYDDGVSIVRFTGGYP